MAKIEIDELEYQQSQQLRGVVQKLMAHPKAAVLIERARKMVEPDAPTPRLDQDEQINAPVEAIRKEFEDYKKKQEDRDAENDKNTKLAMLQKRVDEGNAKLKSEGWTADGLKTLDEFREKEGILDPIAAAAYYEKLHGAVAAPMAPTNGIGGWNFADMPKDGESNAFVKNLLETRGESESLVMQEANKVLKEFRGR